MGQDPNTGAGTIGMLDVAKAVPGLLRDAPILLSGGLGLLLTRGSSKNSIGKVFQIAADSHPGRDFIRFGSDIISYGEANDRVNQYAAVLTDHGVRVGSTVTILATNRPETLLVALAVVKLGATASMLNYNQRGEVLNYSQKLVDGLVFVVGAESSEALASVPSADIRGTVLGLDNQGGKLEGHASLDALADNASTDNPAVCEQVRADTKAFYIFTSGTTGMPKASAMSHYRWLKGMVGLGKLGVRLYPEDTLYCCLPLYHNNALTVALSSVLNSGAALALGKSFSASKFWDEVIRYDATAFVYIGEICAYLLNQPPKPTDRKHRVRVIAGNGLRPAIWDEFTKRFGIPRVCEFYAASEGNTAFLNVFNVDKTTGICPSPIAFVEYDGDTGEPLRGDDGRVRKVKTGEPGLLLSKVNGMQPFDGYTDPSASEKKLVRDAFKGGDVWFNTGDLMRSQGFAHAAFIDRLGDTFRWKGENVATTQVEAAVSLAPQVEEATVFGVEVEGAGGRAGMVALQLKDGQEFDGKALAKAAYEHLPAYAVPLFVRVVKELAHTSTFKSQKVDLRKQGYGAGDEKVEDPLYVLAGRDEGYVPFYEGYPAEVVDGKAPKS
jgi:fatty-acyl-CoA synthase